MYSIESFDHHFKLNFLQGYIVMNSISGSWLVAFTYIFSTPPFALSLIVSAKIIAFFAGLIKIHLIFFLKCYRNADVVHGCSIYYINTQLHMLMKPNAKSNV